MGSGGAGATLREQALFDGGHKPQSSLLPVLPA